MRDHADHHDAELLLRLYDLRREEKLRQAREWVLQEFQADSLEDLHRRHPRGSPENALLRMVVGYWDMAASVVNSGLIQEEFFFENTNEFWSVWEKVKHLAPAVRQTFKNPHVWENLETLAKKYEQWLTKRAPEALDATRRFQAKAAKTK